MYRPKNTAIWREAFIAAYTTRRPHLGADAAAHMAVEDANGCDAAFDEHMKALEADREERAVALGELVKRGKFRYESFSAAPVCVVEEVHGDCAWLRVSPSSQEAIQLIVDAHQEGWRGPFTVIDDEEIAAKKLGS